MAKVRIRVERKRLDGNSSILHLSLLQSGGIVSTMGFIEYTSGSPDAPVFPTERFTSNHAGPQEKKLVENLPEQDIDELLDILGSEVMFFDKNFAEEVSEAPSDFPL